MSRTSEALIHLRAARVQANGTLRSDLRERVIDTFKRLIPTGLTGNILPGARSIFSEAAIDRASTSELGNLRRFFECLQALDVRSKADFIRLAIDGLDEPPRDRPESKYADRARYLLETVFGCKFAYDQKGQLIIGTKAEVEEGVKLKVYSYSRKSVPVFAPIISVPRITIDQAALPQTTALAKRDEVQTIAKKELRLKAELKQAVIELLESGQPELAATVLFSNPERSVYENLALVDEIAKERSLFIFDGYEDLPAAIRLEKDLQDTGLIKTKNQGSVLLLAYLLGRYASVAPVLAAKVIVKIGASWFGMARDIDLVADVFAFMEKDEYRANAIQGLTALGSFKLVDRIIQTGLDESHALYHDRFGGTLDILKERDGDLFLSHAEYKNRSVYRRKPEAVEIKYYSNGESDLKVNDFRDIAEHKQKMVMAMSPDAHLRTTIRELLRKGQDGLAARVAFSGYYDIAIRFENLTKLGFQNMGRLLGSMEEDKRIKVLIELEFGLEGEKRQKAGEEVALAMLWLGGEKNLEKAAAYYQQLVIAEAGFPGSRFAARKLLLLGSLESQTAGDYGLVYDELVKNDPAVFNNDHHRFVKTDGCLSDADAPLGQRTGQAKHYYAILVNKKEQSKNRLIAAHMLELLSGIEYLQGMINIMKKIQEPELAAELFIAIAVIYSQLCEESNARLKLFAAVNRMIKEEKWLSKDTLESCHARIRAAGIKAAPILTLLLYHVKELRIAVIQALGNIEDVEVAKGLMSFLVGITNIPPHFYSSDKEIENQIEFVTTVIEALGNIGHPVTLGMLKHIIDSYGMFEKIRAAAVKVIGQIVKNIRHYLGPQNQQYEGNILEMEGRYIEYLKKIASEDRSETARKEAVKVLLSLGEGEFEFVVKEILWAGNAESIKLAVEGLLDYKERAIQLFKKMLEDNSTFKRKIAAEALLKLKAYTTPEERHQLEAYLLVADMDLERAIALGQAEVLALLKKSYDDYCNSASWEYP